MASMLRHQPCAWQASSAVSCSIECMKTTLIHQYRLAGRTVLYVEQLNAGNTLARSACVMCFAAVVKRGGFTAPGYGSLPNSTPSRWRAIPWQLASHRHLIGNATPMVKKFQTAAEVVRCKTNAPRSPRDQPNYMPKSGYAAIVPSTRYLEPSATRAGCRRKNQPTHREQQSQRHHYATPHAAQAADCNPPLRCCGREASAAT